MHTKGDDTAPMRLITLLISLKQHATIKAEKQVTLKYIKISK